MRSRSWRQARGLWRYRRDRIRRTAGPRGQSAYVSGPIGHTDGVAEIDPEILSYYDRGRERERLGLGRGRLEELRTRDVLERCPPAGGRVLDVGGGTGPYAAWLAGRGYQVDLIDAVPLHVEQARRLGREAGFTARLGDARSLPYGEAAADAVLLLGPLSHLPDRGDSLRCLQEAARVLRPGGVVVAAAISRFASLIDAVRQ
jgi:SAM-dependent methyltransferase